MKNSLLLLNRSYDHLSHPSHHSFLYIPHVRTCNACVCTTCKVSNAMRFLACHIVHGLKRALAIRTRSCCTQDFYPFPPQERFHKPKNLFRNFTPVFTTRTFLETQNLFQSSRSLLVSTTGTDLRIFPMLPSQEHFQKLGNLFRNSGILMVPSQEYFQKLEKFFRNSGAYSIFPPEEPCQPFSVSIEGTRANFST